MAERAEEDSRREKTDSKVHQKATPIEVEVNIEDNDLNEPDIQHSEKYCPTWLIPAKFGRIKVSSCIRGLVIAILGTLIAILFVLSIIPDSPVTAFMAAFLTWLESIPIYYQIITVLVFFTFTGPFGIPVTPTNIACGFLFQFVIGFCVAITGTLLGASLCFLLGKTLLHNWANRQMEKYRILRALGIAVQTQAIKLIILTHLSPILPATLLHYTYSTVGVTFSKFLIGTGVGDLPSIIVYVYIGSVSHSLTSAIAEGDDHNHSLMREIMWMGGIVLVSAVLLIIITWIGKRELNKALAELDRQDEEREDAEMESDSSDDEEDEPVTQPKIIVLDKKLYPNFPRKPSCEVDGAYIKELKEKHQKGEELHELETMNDSESEKEKKSSPLTRENTEIESESANNSNDNESEGSAEEVMEDSEIVEEILLENVGERASEVAKAVEEKSKKSGDS